MKIPIEVPPEYLKYIKTNDSWRKTGSTESFLSIQEYAHWKKPRYWESKEKLMAKTKEELVELLTEECEQATPREVSFKIYD